MKLKKLRIFKRFCRKCGKIYETDKKYSMVCDGCKIKRETKRVEELKKLPKIDFLDREEEFLSRKKRLKEIGVI